MGRGWGSNFFSLQSLPLPSLRILWCSLKKVSVTEKRFAKSCFKINAYLLALDRFEKTDPDLHRVLKPPCLIKK